MTGPNLKADMDEINRALALFFRPGDVVELRALEVPHRGRPTTFSGYFDDMTALASAAAGLSGLAKGVYVTMNEVDPSLLARRMNRVEPLAERGSLTSDTDIRARRWFLIDFDSKRAAGISTTDEEHELAVERALQAREFLTRSGWPLPVQGDSGNGGHLAYAVDLPPDVGGLFKLALAALQEMFGDERVEVDLTVHNPSRIWKLYGTLAAKGDDLPVRPHRLARIFDAPEEIRTVPRERVEALAAMAPQPAQSAKRGKVINFPRTGTANSERGFDVAAWLARHCIQAIGPLPWQGGSLWEFVACPWSSAHKDGAFIAQLTSGAVAAGCHHNSCAGQSWMTLKALFPDASTAVQGQDDVDDVDGGRGGTSQASRLVALMEHSGAELFHGPDGEPFITINVDAHHETYPLKGRLVDIWLRRQFFTSTGGERGGQSGCQRRVERAQGKGGLRREGMPRLRSRRPRQR